MASLSLDSVGSTLERTSLSITTYGMAIRGHMLSCTGKPAYGEIHERVRALQEAQHLWRAVGFNTFFTFAREMNVCKALRQIPDVLCEHRVAMDPAANQRTAHLFEQPVLQALCLAYARASKAEFLALVDADDHAPSTLPLVLDAVRRHGHIAGVRLFFDAEMTCPPGYCPWNESDWRSKCPMRKSPTSRPAPRNHWKPLIVPNRTRDVSVHQLWPVVPAFKRKQVWQVCLHHRWIPARLHAAATENEEPRFMTQRNRNVHVDGLLV